MQAAVRRARIIRPSLSWRRSSRLLASSHAQSCSITQRTEPSPEPCGPPLADRRSNAFAHAEAAVAGAVVAGIGIQPADGSTGDLGQAQETGKDPGVVDFGG